MVGHFPTDFNVNGYTSGYIQCHISYEARETRVLGPMQSRGPQHESWHSICSYSLPTH